jgi:hypothetical protein
VSIEEIAERFQRETANHAMTVLHDNGLYRHLLFADTTPGQSWCYRFELITVPGSLIFRGDGESFVFGSSEPDLFEVFTRSSTYGLNPSYWAQNLTSSREAAKSYSQERFNERVVEELEEAESTHPGITEAWTTWLKEGDGSWYDTTYEIPARQALNDFRFQVAGAEGKPFRFLDTDDWKLQDYDWWYLWACHAIVWGIGQYDKAREQVAS